MTQWLPWWLPKETIFWQLHGGGPYLLYFGLHIISVYLGLLLICFIWFYAPETFLGWKVLISATRMKLPWWGQYKISRLINTKNPPHWLAIPLNHIAFSRNVHHSPLLEQCASRINESTPILEFNECCHDNIPIICNICMEIAAPVDPALSRPWPSSR